MPNWLSRYLHNTPNKVPDVSLTSQTPEDILDVLNKYGEMKAFFSDGTWYVTVELVTNSLYISCKIMSSPYHKTLSDAVQVCLYNIKEHMKKN